MPSLSSGIDVRNAIFLIFFFSRFRSIDGSVQNVQIDCQLGESQSPVILYLSPTSKSDESRHMPAINFSAHKVIGQSKLVISSIYLFCGANNGNFKFKGPQQTMLRFSNISL